MYHHATSPRQQDPTIPPAVLASSLLPLPDDAPPRRVLTLLEPLDKLTGGFCYGTRTLPGELVGVCIEKTTRSNLNSTLLHSLLASHLTARNTNQVEVGRAFYIDATGDFSPRLLFQSVLHILKRNSNEQAENKTKEQLEAKATTLLDNVSCMRVLDAVGLDEAVAEVQQELMPQVHHTDKWRQEGVVGDSQAMADSQDDEDLLSLLHVHDATTKAASPDGDTNINKGLPLVLLAYPLSLLYTLQNSKGLVHHNARLAALFHSLRLLTAPPVCACVVLLDSSFAAALAARPLDLGLVLALDRRDARAAAPAWRLHVAKDRRSDRQGRRVEFAESSLPGKR